MPRCKWTWLLAALLAATGIGCGHSRCGQCGSSGSSVRIASTDSPTLAQCRPCAQPTALPVADAGSRPRRLDVSVEQSVPLEQPATGSIVTRSAATAPIRYDHARDYAWVVGQLQYLHTKKQWRVRYAALDKDDEFGGAMTIVGVEHLADQFKDGMNVRLKGQLVDPDTREMSPNYYVYDMRIVE